MAGKPLSSVLKATVALPCIFVKARTNFAKKGRMSLPHSATASAHLLLFCCSLGAHLPLTCCPLAAHLPLTCHSLAAHLPLTGSMWTAGVSIVAERAQTVVLVRVHLKNPVPYSFKTTRHVVFCVHTICFEGSGSPQECNILGHMGSRWHPSRCEPGKIM